MSEPLAEPAVEPEPIAAVEPAVEPAADPVAPSEPTAAFDLNAPEVQEQIANLSQQQTLALLERLGLVTYDQPAGPTITAPDPLSDNYPAELEAWYQAKQAETLAPYAQFIQSQQADRIDGQIGATIDNTLAQLDIAKPEDPVQAQAFTDVIRAVAESFTEQAVRSHGQTPAAAQAAVKLAVDYIAADRKAAADAAVEAYKASLTGGGSRIEPGVRVAGVLAAGEPQSEAEVARLFRERQPA